MIWHSTGGVDTSSMLSCLSCLDDIQVVNSHGNKFKVLQYCSLLFLRALSFLHIHGV